jgi:hypothetical protein
VRFAAPQPPDAPPPPEAPFDLVVALHRLAGLPRPGEELQRWRRLWSPEAVLVAAVPPVADDATRARHRQDPRLAGSRYVWEWQELLARSFGDVRVFRHEAPAGVGLDLTDPRPSRLRAEDFAFRELTAATLHEVGSLSVVLLCSRPLAR